jgi:hypothetical protein
VTRLFPSKSDAFVSSLIDSTSISDALEEWHRCRNGPRAMKAPIPGNHDTRRRELSTVIARDKDHRSPGMKEGCLGEEVAYILGGVSLVLRQHGKICRANAARKIRCRRLQ